MEEDQLYKTEIKQKNSKRNKRETEKKSNS